MAQVQSGGKKAKELGSIEVNLGDFAANNTSVSKDFKFAKYLLPPSRLAFCLLCRMSPPTPPWRTASPLVVLERFWLCCSTFGNSSSFYTPG